MTPVVSAPPTHICWYCDHASEVEIDPALEPILRCSECGCASAFGAPLPRITIDSDTDRRFLCTKFEEHMGADGKPSFVSTFKMSHAYAAELALEILSVSAPDVYAMISGLTRFSPSEK